MLEARKEIIMLHSELGVCVTQEFPTGWTEIMKGSFPDPQFDPQAATDLFCYNENTGTGAFFATVKNGQFDDGPRKVGRNHIFIRQWTHIVYIPIVAISFPAPHIDKLLLFYDAASGLAELYETDGRGNINLKKQYSGWRISWTQIIAGQFGKANLLFYDEANRVGEFYTINNSGDLQLIEGWS
jgi:hypothetical protein